MSKDLLIDDLEQLLAETLRDKKRELILAIIDEKIRRRNEMYTQDKTKIK